MEIEVTQADRDLLKSLLSADDELCELIDKMQAFTGEAWEIARHRQAALIEGARAMQEAAALGIQQVRDRLHLNRIACAYAEAETRALDPKAVVKEAKGE